MFSRELMLVILNFKIKRKEKMNPWRCATTKCSSSKLETKVSHATAQELRSSASRTEKAPSLGDLFKLFYGSKNHQLARERPQKLPKGCLTSPWSSETTRESTRRQSWISFPPSFLFFLSIRKWFNFIFLFKSFKYRFHCCYVCVCDSESKKKPRENRKKEEAKMLYWSIKWKKFF